ncbi:MAG: hypothetical protein K1X89_24360 [Myxococcaceae bacterium]|nr:hypothetical protein [Myxococcaceae bacterium]
MPKPLPADTAGPPSRRTARWSLVFVLALVLAALVAAASFAATAQVATHGAFALATREGRVAFSLGDEVLVTDEAGTLLATASDENGSPHRFADVSSLSFDEQGGLLVTDGERHQLLHFDAQARGGTVLPLQSPPQFTFEVLQVGDRRLIADTMGHHLQVLAADGSVLTSRRALYPNGLSLATLGARQALVFAETGQRAARVWSLDLEPIDWPAVDRLNADLKKRHPRELLEVAITPQGALLAADCRDTAGDCTVLRADPLGKTLDRVADVRPFDAPDADATEGLLGVGELAATSDGRVLIASARLGAVLEVSGPSGGAPPGDFCAACDDAELRASPIDFASLAIGRTWKNGAQLRRFGDASVQERVERIWSARRLYAGIERSARAGTWAIATALLAALLLARQAGAGAAASRSRLEHALATLAKPHLGALLVSLLPVALGFAGGLVVGLTLFGWAGAAGVAVAGGVAAGRLLTPRLLAATRHPRAATDAYALYLGPDSGLEGLRRPGERLLWARFAQPRHAVVKEAKAIAISSRFDDVLDALELLVPRLTLLVRTDQRLLAVQTSLLGAPLDNVFELDATEVPTDLDGVGELVVQAPCFTRRWRLGEGSPSRASCAQTRVLCEQCGRSAGSCDHTRGELAVPVLASLVFPGLGALVLGDLARARLAMVVALGFLLEVMRVYLPQSLGTLPPDPGAWLTPLGGYVVTALSAAGTMVFVGMRARRRADVGGTT